MNRTEKKTENAIIRALNNVCETLKNEYSGFSWLTHFVVHSEFPESLKIVCVFDTNHSLEAAKNSGILHSVTELTKFQFEVEGVSAPSIGVAIYCDSEENGADAGSNRWCLKYK